MGLMATRKNTRLLLIVVVALCSASPFLLSLFADIRFSVSGSEINQAQAALNVVHVLFDWATIFVALLCVIFSFLRFSVSGESLAWVMGVVFILISMTDVFHAVASGKLTFGSIEDQAWVNAMWVLSRTVNAALLVLGAVVLLFLTLKKSVIRVSSVLVVVTSYFLLSVVFAIWVQSAEKDYVENWVSRPLDLFPLIIFGLAIPLLWKLYKRHPSFLTASLCLAVVPAISAEAYMVFGGKEDFDHYFNSAQGLRLVSYTLPFFGYLLDFRQLFVEKQNVYSQALLKAEQRYQSINFLMPVGVLLVNKKGFIVEANQQALDMFGYSLTELVGLNVDELVPESIRENHASLRAGFNEENRMRKMAAENANLMGQRKSGEIFSVEIGLAPIVLDAERYVVASIMDVSERKQMVEELGYLAKMRTELNQELMKAEQRYRSINFLMPVGILLVDGSGRIIEANRQAQDMFGYDDAELDGTNVDNLVPNSIRSSHAKLREGFSKENRMRKMAAENANLMGQRRSGEIFPVEIGLAPIELDGQRFVVASVMDVSERKRMVEELREKNLQMDEAIDNLTRSNEQLERFAFVCSHDLQEPVRMVLSFSQLLERRIKDQLDKKSQEYLAYVTDGAIRAREMISDILTFCRLDQNTDASAKVNLSEVCQQVENTLQGLIAEKRARMIWSDDLPSVVAVPSQVFQLILNLVNNGFKFNRSEQPTVQISCVEEPQYWSIQVKDNGIGIDPKYQSKLFQIFQRLNTKAEFPGTGIGLAICKKIADQHGAEIVIKSQPEQGATFVINWPKASLSDEE